MPVPAAPPVSVAPSTSLSESFHYVLAGSSALGGHAGRSILGRLQVIDPSVTAVDASYFYLVASSRSLEDDDRRRLQALLDDAPQKPPSGEGAVSIHVTARLGTLSAWSSKATDIAHNCAM